ncbi:hypothetical protein MASR2M54_26000 [Aliarcobacter cryaerophilus]
MLSLQAERQRKTKKQEVVCNLDSKGDKTIIAAPVIDTVSNAKC